MGWDRPLQGYFMVITRQDAHEGEPERVYSNLDDAALARCMAIHPPTGAERRLHPDANRLADLFGLTMYQRTPAVSCSAGPADILESYVRWCGPLLVVA